MDINRLSDKFSKVKFLDNEAVSELSNNLTLPKISRCTVIWMSKFKLFQQVH